MGAEYDSRIYTNKSLEEAKEAFRVAVEQALYDYGHAGYTGSIAEFTEFKLINHTAASAEEADEYIMDNHRDKWGPTWIVPFSNGAQHNKGYVIGGYFSS
jgi:hypothetical protein